MKACGSCKKILMPTSFAREIMPSIPKNEQEILLVVQRPTIDNGRTE
jgi:hypothetical protein